LVNSVLRKFKLILSDFLANFLNHFNVRRKGTVNDYDYPDGEPDIPPEYREED
jgi:hypothetical protein